MRPFEKDNGAFDFLSTTSPLSTKLRQTFNTYRGKERKEAVRLVKRDLFFFFDDFRARKVC